MLAKGGRTLNTIFLLNDESRALLESPSSPHGETFEFEGRSRIKTPEDPEAWIALDERLVLDAHERAGLEIAGIRYGRWCGRESSGPGFGAKDHVVAHAGRRRT